MSQGWIKLHRELMDKAIWQDSSPEHKAILITLLMMANHKEKEWEWKGEKYKARPGQFVTSLEKIANKAGKGISIQNVRSCLLRLEKYEFLTNESTNRNRLITIVNWELYQSQDEEPTNKPTSNQQATNKQPTTNKNDKNVKNDLYIYTDNTQLIDAIKEFQKMRTKIKKPLTDRALQMLLSKLDTLAKDDETKIAILEQSIMNSWQGVFPLKETTKPVVKKTGFHLSESRLTKYTNEELEKKLLKRGG